MLQVQGGGRGHGPYSFTLQDYHETMAKMQVACIEDNMREYHLKLFGHVLHRHQPTDAPVNRCGTMVRGGVKMIRDRPKIT